jgi:hypothetical protein
MLSAQEQEETMRGVRHLIDEFKRDEQLGPIAAATPEICAREVRVTVINILEIN